MSQIPSPSFPQFSSDEFHQKSLAMLSILKETRNSKGSKDTLYSYIEWLYSKNAMYERDTRAWEIIKEGAGVRTCDEYVTQALYKLEQDKETIHQRVSQQKRQAQQEILQARNQQANELQEHEYKIQVLRNEIVSLESSLHVVRDQAGLAEGGYYEYSNPAEASVRLKKKLDSIKANIKDMQRAKTAINAVSGFTFNNSQAQGKKFVKDFSTLMLTAYNQEVENTIVKLEKTRGLDTAISRVQKASERVEKLGTLMSMSISPLYHNLRLQEIEIAFEFKEAETQRKEQEQQERERLREEEKIRREAEKIIQEAERKEKEKRDEIARLLSYQQQHYANVAGALQTDDPKYIELKNKIDQLEGEIANIQDNKVKAESALLNTRAGYVYIISNIGSFGEGIVKIGLTRRQDPADRVKELSSASVPFIFDTHAIHFSDDAVALENALHKHFRAKRVNKINERKEFFRVTLDEVKQALIQYSGNGSTLQFVDKAEAIDYRKTIGEIK